MEPYTLEKWIWTDDDFDKMGWHDATIYGIRLDQNLNLDIDYIFKWNQPEVEGFQFTFYVAPCTLVFKDIQEMKFEISQEPYRNNEISDIEREVRDGKSYFTIDTQQGFLFIITNGFKEKFLTRKSRANFHNMRIIEKKSWEKNLSQNFEVEN